MLETEAIVMLHNVVAEGTEITQAYKKTKRKITTVYCFCRSYVIRIQTNSKEEVCRKTLANTVATKENTTKNTRKKKEHRNLNLVGVMKMTVT